MWSAGEGDDKERFLADLRALRDGAAVGYDELATRTHYPNDILKEAESGPSLPGLPILAAYVRACDGDVPAWEERWRRLGFDASADPGLPIRPPGASAAAEAGARASVGVAPPDAYDPDRIRAALRGIHHSDRGALSTASRGNAAAAGRNKAGTPPARPRPQEYQTGWSAGTSRDGGWDEAPAPGRASTAEGAAYQEPTWDTGVQRDAGPRWEDGTAASLTGTPDTGNNQFSEPSDAPIAETPDDARAEAMRRDPFSADRLQGNEPLSGHVIESGWQDHADSRPSPAGADSWFTRRDLGTREAGLSSPDTDATQSWFSPREPTETGLALPPPSGGRAGAAPADAGLAAEEVAGFRSSAEGHAAPRTSRSAPAETPASPVTPAGDAHGTAERTALVPLQDVSAAPSHTADGSAEPPEPADPSLERRSDRLYPVRLLVVIVVAALIGSVLVLLLR
jgi:hypothetical protein